MKDRYQEFISRPEVSFWVPVFFTIFTTVTTWAYFGGVVITKLDQMAADIQEIKMLRATDLQAMNRIESHVCTLDTESGHQCIATQ